MRVIVAGSRTIEDYALASSAIQRSGFQITEIVSGTARGVDSLGERYARERGIPVRRFPAQWERFGRRAGFLRNSAMAHYADALVLVWDGRSPGSRLMLALARERRLPCFVVVVR